MTILKQNNMKRILTLLFLLLSAGGFAQSITEVIYPQYIQGVGSGNAADDRKVPYACRMTVNGLTPNTVYRGYNKFVTDPTLTDNGQGNYIVVDPATGTFSRVTSASLAVVGRYLEFTTDASGSYTGWFINEPTIATTHFQPGIQIYFRLMLNDGAGGSFVATRVTATNAVTVIGFGAGSTAGTGIRGSANAALIPKNFVMLYNNIAGTGRPLSGTFIENDGTDNTVANGYAPFYETNVNAIANTWGSIIPNNLPTGVNNISQYALSNGGLVNSCTAANGVYNTTNTSNASGGLTELVISCTPTGGCNISVSAAATNVLCSAGTTGSVALTTTGGTGPFTYSVNGGASQSSNIFSGLGAGNYTFSVTDANACTATTVAAITQPSVLTASSQAGIVLCNAGSTTVTVSATGGTAPYTGTGTFTRTAGAYSYTVTDANGCTAITTGTISQPTILSAASTAGTIACNGGTTSVTVTATGGTAPYTGTGTFTRSAGAYSYTVTDANGCTAVATGTISQPTVLSAASTAGTIACNGGTTTVTVTATGGTAPYTGTGTFTRSAGAYTYTVTDANGCTAVTTGTITQPAVLGATSQAGTIACNGGTTTVTVSGTGGTAPYTGTGTFTRTAGAYSYTVTDARGCTAVTTGTITQPTVLTASSVAGTILVSGGSAIVTVSATGGTSPYTGTGSFTRTAGTYTFTVTDANGCTATTIVTLTEPGVFSASSTAGTIACFGGTTTVTVTATGGTAPYTGTGTFTRSAGAYSFTVTDANGATAVTSGTITQPTLLASASTTGTIACNGGTTTVTVTATGGTAPYTGTGTFTRSAGAYTYTVTDARGCTAVTTGTISQPALLTAASVAGTITIPGGTTTVTVTATGGTAPYTGTGTFTRSAGAYSYTVTDANGCTAVTTGTITEPAGNFTAASLAGTIACFGGTTTVTVSATGGTAPYTGTGVFTRGAGSYSYTVTDATGATAVTTGTISQPTQLTVASTAGVIAACATTTTVIVTATGGTAPYTGTGTFTRGAGAYTYTVTDARGCTATTTGTIAQPATSTLLASSTTGTIACNAGTTTVTVTATGGTAPYTGIGTFTRSAGAYSYTVTDANGCTAVTSGTITQPSILVANSTAGTIACNATTTTVTVSATGGTAPYTGTGSFTVSAGAYSYTVTDARGCTKVTSGNIAPPVPCNTGCSYTSSITQNFNNTAIPAGRTIWFSSVIDLEKCGTATVNISVTNARITFKRNNVPVTLTVPDSRTSFVYGTVIATTQFVNNKWVTVSPSYTFDRNLFMSGLAYIVPSGGLPAGVKDVKWTADINIDQPGVEIKWKWAAATYSHFATNNASIAVKPIDWFFQNYYFNADKAGTPENFKSRLVSGGTGNGAANYTGNYSGTRTLSCGCNSGKQELPEAITGTGTQEGLLELTAMPNPSSSYFKLLIKANDNKPVTVRVTDIAGRMIAIYPNLGTADKKTGNMTLQLGESWKNGIYIAEVLQGSQRQVVKLVKAN